MIAEVCWPCVCGLHEECFCPDLAPEDNEDGTWVVCCCYGKPIESEEGAFVRGVGRPLKDPSEITDITSTGRKRAAMLYPIMEGMLCEWAGLKFAGGGVEPIIGCPGNTLSASKGAGRGDRHHGPDKNVINNSPDNVHRICSDCHNRWHALNNKYYGDRPAADMPYLPVAPEGLTVQRHDRETRATEEEIMANEAFWAVKADRRHAVVDISED